MTRTINYFMWGYQDMFQLSAQSAAQRILDKLDARLQPNLFLVGVLIDERENRHPVCLEPEDCGHGVSEFDNVKQLALSLQTLDSENHILHSHPLAQQRHVDRIEKAAISNAILQCIDFRNKHDGKVTFCSGPIKIDSYLVCIVLELDRTAFESLYALRNSIYQDRYKVPTSLVGATVDRLLRSLANALYKPEPGAGLGVLEQEEDEVIRNGGRDLMGTVSWAVDKPGESLFEACNNISLTNYEGSVGIGRILISRPGHPNVIPTLKFVKPIKMSEKRAIRKLLELTSKSTSLLCDGTAVYGLGSLTGNYILSKEDLFTLDFVGHYSWELTHANQVLMRVDYRDPRIPKPKIDEGKFQSNLSRIFPSIDSNSPSLLWDLVQAASDQKHGTMVVVTSDAKSEAVRLQQQSTLIEPIRLTPEVMEVITAIDGAVVIDPDAKCYAIGVILDGLATHKGTSSRGARYNSAIRYVEGKEECVAIIVSADGTIDIVPDLRPQISRDSIAERLTRLREIADTPLDNSTYRPYGAIMSWFQNHEFYLSADQCEEINSLRRRIEKAKKATTMIQILYRDLKPNKELNESYFLD